MLEKENEKLQILYPIYSDEMMELNKEYDKLGAKLFSFMKYVRENWKVNP